jgi:phosphoserine phosphatase RsbU/P
MKWSIQKKLLLLLIAMPLVSTLCYLLLVGQLFKSDKMAYVFDSTLSSGQALAGQLRSELDRLDALILPLMDGMNKKTFEFDRLSQKYFKQKDDLLALFVFQVFPDGKYTLVNQLQRPGHYLDQEVVTPLVTPDSLKKKTGSLFKLQRFEEGLLWFYRPYAPVGTTDFHFLTLSLVQRPEMVGFFQAKDIYFNSLIGEDGKIIIGPEKSEDGTPMPWTNQNVLKRIFSQGVREGTLEIKMGSEEWLISYSKVHEGPFLITSAVEKNTALSALKILLIKSLLFLVTLISFSIVLALISSKKITQGLADLSQATQKISEGDFQITLDTEGSDEVADLGKRFKSMASEIGRLLLQTAEKARMEEELKTAKLVQETLFPPLEYEGHDTQISGRYIPASECGGDWWYYLQKDNRLVICIGDATGHGAPAALITSAACSALNLMCHAGTLDPSFMMNGLNHSLHLTARGRVCMTFFLGVLDMKTGILEYALAGHEPPLVFKNDGEAGYHKKNIIPLNANTGPRLGEQLSGHYEKSSYALAEGDIIFLYTDGITDLKNKSQKSLGERKMIQYFADFCNETKNISEATEKFQEKIMAFGEGEILYDDVTYFVLKRQKNAVTNKEIPIPSIPSDDLLNKKNEAA